MSRILTLLLAVALSLPVGAYAVGTLVSSSTDEPDDRAPIVLRDPPSSQVPSPSATPGEDRGGRDDDDDDAEGDDDGPEAVVPTYADLDDDDEDDADDADDSEDAEDDRRDAAEDRRDDRRDALEDAREDRDGDDD